MLTFYLQAAGYLAFAGCVTALSWRTQMRIVGLALILASCVSAFSVMARATVAQSAIIEVMLALIITIASLEAWTRRGGFMAKMAVAFAFADMCFAGSVCLLQDGSWQMGQIFATVTNVIFAAQCLCVATPGARNAIGTVVGMWRSAINNRGSLDVDGVRRDGRD